MYLVFAILINVRALANYGEQQYREWIDDVEAVANNAVANGFTANVVPTHNNKALGEI